MDDVIDTWAAAALSNHTVCSRYWAWHLGSPDNELHVYVDVMTPFLGNDLPPGSNRIMHGVSASRVGGWHGGGKLGVWWQQVVGGHSIPHKPECAAVAAELVWIIVGILADVMVLLP